MREANARFEAGIQTVIEHGPQSGQLDQTGAAGLARCITGAVNGMVILARGSADHEALQGYVERVVMRAWPDSPA